MEQEINNEDLEKKQPQNKKELNHEKKVKTTSKEIKESNKFLKIIKELIPYVIILIVVIIIRTYFIKPIFVNGPSMQSTLDGGEIMLLNKMPKEFERFEIVVIKTDYEDIIKRVIALPGEKISCQNGIVYVNDRRQDEEYSKGVTSDFDPITLGEDEYFVMGDNREESADSRSFGPFHSTDIKGKTNLVIFPFNKFGKVE